MENELVQLIVEYENYIQKGNLYLKDIYNINTSPFLAKNNNSIPAENSLFFNGEYFSFRFHGIGCCFKFNSVVVDFDYSFNNFIYEGFDKIKLFNFILSLNSNIFNDYKTYNNVLLKLHENGIVTTPRVNSNSTYDYILNKNLVDI